MICPKCGKELEQEQKQCPACGLIINELPDSRKEDRTETGHSMKWFKFIIYVQLFVSAASFLWTAVSSFFGLQYEEYGELVYDRIPALKWADSIYGILCLGMIFLCLVVRSDLAKFKTGAPKKYMVFYIVSGVINIAYIVLVAGLVIGATGDASALTDVAGDIFIQIISTVIYIILNNVYFKKRESLFKN